LVGIGQGAGILTPQCLDQPVLERSPAAFYAALGLRCARQDQVDAELLKGPGHLRRFPAPGQFLRERPGLFTVTGEDPVAVAVPGEGDAALVNGLAQQSEVALSVLLLAEERVDERSGGVVDGA
jgi:hypothetical protein